MCVFVYSHARAKYILPNKSFEQTETDNEFEIDQLNCICRVLLWRTLIAVCISFAF